MKHPNEGFLRRFLGTDKAYQEQMKSAEKKQRVIEHFKNKENKTFVLNENKKSSFTKAINTIYSGKVKTNLNEQKTDLKDWQLLQTEYGMFYYNKSKKLWMNTFGDIKKSLGEFIQAIDYGTIDGNSKASSTQIPAPSDLQVTILNGGVGDFNIQFTDNSNNEVGFAIYITQVS